MSDGEKNNTFFFSILALEPGIVQALVIPLSRECSVSSYLCLKTLGKWILNQTGVEGEHWTGLHRKNEKRKKRKSRLVTKENGR